MCLCDALRVVANEQVARGIEAQLQRRAALARHAKRVGRGDLEALMVRMRRVVAPIESIAGDHRGESNDLRPWIASQADERSEVTADRANVDSSVFDRRWMSEPLFAALSVVSSILA